MSLLDRLEYRLGRFAIPGLMRYVVFLNAAVYILAKLYPGLPDALNLDRVAVMHGEVWRLVTFIFIPQFGGLLPEWFNAAMYMMFLYWVGNSLDHALGAFRLNVSYFTGVLGVGVAAFFLDPGFSAAILNTSLLFAFAQFYPDEIIFVMYILPAKVKWLAWLAAVGMLFVFLTGGWSVRAAVLVSLANYFLFFGPELYRNARLRGQVSERRRKFEAAKAPVTASLHECVVCHRTEITHPDMDFRVAKDGQEYCREHLPKPPGAVAAAA
jgi:hypothetical protein